MATRSYIGKANTDGSVTYIYCHFDGYPSHNGKILVENYNTTEKVSALLKLGDLSILGKEIGQKQDFDDRKTHNDDWCLAYGRDRGEYNTDIEAKSGVLQEIIGDQDYTYIFDRGKWRCWQREKEIQLEEAIQLITK